MNPLKYSSRYVLLADVIDSSSIPDRAEFREDLLKGIEQVNAEYGSDLHVEYDLIKGIDEFGAVLSELSNLYEMISTILNRVHPVQIRFGVAAGDVDVDPEKGDISSMDGPAFHLADLLLDEVEDDNLFIYIDTGSPADILVANTINLLLMQREQWTEHQVDAVRAYERGGTQSDAAKRLGVQQQTISKALTSIRYQETKLLRKYLRDVIPTFYDE